MSKILIYPGYINQAFTVKKIGINVPESSIFQNGIPCFKYNPIHPLIAHGDNNAHFYLYSS